MNLLAKSHVLISLIPLILLIPLLSLIPLILLIPLISLLLYPHFFKDEVHQPRWPNQQELNVLQE